MRVCVNCGTEVPDEAKFCPKCGAVMLTDGQTGVEDSDRINLMKIFSLAAIIVSVLIAVTYFLPYVDHTDEQMRYVNDFEVTDGVTIKADAVRNLSIEKYLQVYITCLKNPSALGVDSTYLNVYIGVYVVVVIISMLILIFSIFRKRIPSIIFCVILMLLNYICAWDFKSRNIVGEDYGILGIASYLYYTLPVALIVIDIISMVIKRTTKKA